MFNKQGEELFSKMMNESNSDGIMLSYQFNGEISVIKNFQSVKQKFRFRARMFTDKGNTYIHCGKIETDEHYMDLFLNKDMLSNLCFI